jgi:hypothetical protein
MMFVFVLWNTLNSCCILPAIWCLIVLGSVVSVHPLTSSPVYYLVWCCSDVIRAVNRTVFFCLMCYADFLLWHGFCFV